MVEIEPGDPFPGNATLVVTVSGRAFQAPGERPLFTSESLVPSGCYQDEYVLIQMASLLNALQQ
jgi:hypothetical protein